MLTTEAGNHIAQFYSTLRSKEADKTLPVTARTLETLIRLATAHAKARLSRQVEEQDAMVSLGEGMCFAFYHQIFSTKPDRPVLTQGCSGSDSLCVLQ